MAETIKTPFPIARRTRRVAKVLEALSDGTLINRPALKRPGTKLTANERIQRTRNAIEKREAITRVLEQLERSAGGRERLIAALSYGPRDDVIEKLVDRLCGTETIGAIFASFPDRITLGDLKRAYVQGNQILAEIITARVSTDGIEAIVQDVVRRAAPHEEPCTVCGGDKVDESGKSCTVCHGTGVQRILPTLDRQRFSLALAGVEPESAKKSPLIQQTFDGRSLHVHSADGYAKLLEATDRILYREPLPSPDIVDAVPIAQEPAEIPLALSDEEGRVRFVHDLFAALMD